ncbi:hypothetical protein BpHYR1_050098 [Brachionus plicatilis]|uniref:Uncharacterized protein n=1 Tax=Brachionus plicatilis TaxID=10195 RepID=A0A3M7PGM8_BRAPC|nr:hypothetical protein BpHYR1_050098 [Brachionus plicatilis]
MKKATSSRNTMYKEKNKEKIIKKNNNYDNDDANTTVFTVFYTLNSIQFTLIHFQTTTYLPPKEDKTLI